MNRILRAEVIVTLSRDQAALLLATVNGSLNGFLPLGDIESIREIGPLLLALNDQCAKQGVQL